MAVTRPSKNFRTKQSIVFNESTQPYVGFEKENDLPNGWRFDIKRWNSIFDLRLPTLPRLADFSIQGVQESEYFKSGVGSKEQGDLEVTKIDEIFRNNERLRVPVLNPGYYYKYKTRFYLFSDNSRIQYIDPDDNKDDKNFITLDVEPNLGTPILAANFIRIPNSREFKYRTFVQEANKFTGLYSNNEELETITNIGKIYWDNVDTTKKEFIVDTHTEGSTYLRFNKDYIETIGVVPQVYQDLAACEVLGVSDGTSYQAFYLKNFPILADDTFHLYVVNGYYEWEEWFRITNWPDFILNNTVYDKSYFVDKDLGIVYFATANNGDVPALGSYIVASYKTTLRIEYEEEQDSTKLIKAYDANINPINNFVNQGFVCITHEPLDVAYIKLEIDKSRIQLSSNPVQYGPIYAGSDYAILKATVSGIDNTFISGTEVTFSMRPKTLGYLDGSTESLSISNARGEALTSYQPPVSASSMGYYSTTVRTSTHPSYTAHKDVIINSTQTGLEGLEESLYIYQILKNDILLGYDSVESYIADNFTIPPWVLNSGDYHTAYSRWIEEVILEYDLKDWAGVQPDGTIAGRKVVIYMTNPSYYEDNYDSTAINPVTGLSGAIVPVRPVLIEKITDSSDSYYGKYRAIYPADAIPDPDPDNSSNPVGGYWLVCSKLVTFQASCYSSYYNKTIYSNEITARISLPTYLTGEYISNSRKIPYGWKVPSDTDNKAAGLDGATFITINPYDGPYSIINPITGTETGDWASAPFRTIGFQIEVE